ncbi:MAG: PAS domain S-box protein, partial [Acetobacteraceae bacterium]|nr:PAS domain S-box protein [Acetobacteraceae bacterium]
MAEAYPDRDGRRARVLILAPTGRDASLTAEILQRAGLSYRACASLADLEKHLDEGAGLALIAEEGLSTGDIRSLLRWVETQPSWSDIPFLVLVENGALAAPGGRAYVPLERIANVTLLERPTAPTELVSAIRSGLRARNRQYQVHDALCALETSERQYRTLADAIPQLAWTCLPSGECDYLNSQWEAFSGLPIGQQLGFGWLDRVVHPEDRQRVKEAWQALGHRREDHQIQFRMRRSDGVYRHFMSRATPIIDTDGAIARWFGTSTDISDIVAAREALERTQESLEALVAERNRSLIAAHEQLKAEVAERERTQEALRQSQKLEAVGQLTSGIAHDFNNLLTAVLGNLEMAADCAIDPAAERFLKSATGAAQRGATLTQQLLAFSRKQHLELKTLDLNRLVTDASDMLFRTIGATVRIEKVLTDDLWLARADPTQLEVVLLNLAINARDAMPDGGLMTIRTANAPAGTTPSDLTLGDYVLVSVTDTGIGMSDDTLRKAVEPFFTTKAVGKGSGLGLSMVAGVAMQSGGGITIDSSLGHGTTVTIYLPRGSEMAAPTAQPIADAPIASAARVKILVVDDDPDVRTVTVNGLLKLGYDVTAADDGPGGLVALA